MKTLWLVVWLSFLLCSVVARADEITCPDLYCWLPLAPGAEKVCTVQYEFATGRCRSACGLTIPNSGPGDSYTKRCPGIPGMLSYCVAYLEVQPVPFASDEDAGDYTYTTAEGEGGCAYWPAP